MCWFCFLLKWHLVFPFSYHSKFKVFHLLDLNWKRSIKRYAIYYQLGLICDLWRSDFVISESYLLPVITPICKDKYPLVLCLDCYGHFLIMEGNLSLIFINLNNFIPIHPLILILIENVFSLNTVQSSYPNAWKLIKNKVPYLAYLRRCIENSMENMHVYRC